MARFADGIPPARRFICRPLFLTPLLGTLRFAAFVGDTIQKPALLARFDEERLGVLPSLNRLVDLATHSP